MADMDTIKRGSFVAALPDNHKFNNYYSDDYVNPYTEKRGHKNGY